MQARRSHKFVAVALVGSLAVAGLVAAASAESSVQVALEHKRELRERILQIQETRRVRRIMLHRRIRSRQALLERAPGVTQTGDRSALREFRRSSSATSPSSARKSAH